MAPPKKVSKKKANDKKYPTNKREKKELKTAQEKAWKRMLKQAQQEEDSTFYQEKENTKKKLKERDPPFAAIRKEVTDSYEGKTKYPPFTNEKEMKKFLKGKGKGKAQAIEEHFGPGSIERLIQGKKSKVPIGMRGGGRVGRGMGKALRGGGAVTRS